MTCLGPAFGRVARVGRAMTVNERCHGDGLFTRVGLQPGNRIGGIAKDAMMPLACPRSAPDEWMQKVYNPDIIGKPDNL
jgi:hypothetical protein